jgi:hypothetical protein
LKNKKAILNELQCLSGIIRIASTLSQEALYKIVSITMGGKLYKDAARKIKGLFYKDGKILEQN